MVDRPEPRCLPIEVEMLPLYREPSWAARLRREQKRERRRARRKKRASAKQALTGSGESEPGR